MSEQAENTDNRMRHNYRPLDEKEKMHILALKDAGLSFLTLCDSIGTSRELSVAKTNMEQAVMWAVKHMTA